MAASGKELPRAWNWCTGENISGPTPAWQAERLAAGDPLVPHIEFYAFHKWNRAKDYATPGLQAARKYDLPVIFVYQNLFDTWRTREPWASKAWSSNPNDHPLQITKSGKVKKQLTFWSNRTDYAYDLGRFLATTEYTKECAKLYPDPPYIVFADNGETGTVEKRVDVLDDIRVPERIERLIALRDSLPEPGPAREDNYGNERTALDGYIDYILDDASRQGYTQHYTAFRRGFRDGLATHAPLWADRFHWIMYGQAGNEFQVNESKNLDQYTDYRYEAIWAGATGSDHAYRHDWGPTGQLYVQPWYGGFHVLRTVIQGDNVRYAMDLREEQGFQQPRFQLTWEGRDTNLKERPTREQWRGLVRYWLWVSGSDYFGHFAESQATTDDPRISVYYAEVIAACKEVHNDPVLKDFWLNGTLQPSTRPSPYEWPRNTPPYLIGRPWYLTDIIQQNRYNGTRDIWLIDRTRRQPINVLGFTVKHKDGRILRFTAGLEQSYERAPVGGIFSVE